MGVVFISPQSRFTPIDFHSKKDFWTFFCDFCVN